MSQLATVDKHTVRQLRHDPNERPFIVIWEVTRACDLACVHCRAEAVPERHPLELSTDEGRRLLDDVASFGKPAPLLVLTGGDPFARPDLVDLVAHARGLGLSVALSPSVTPRLTREVLADLRAAGAKAVSLSLDGATPATHDGFRQVDGVFEATLEAAHWVHELGMRLQINSTVTSATAPELPDILTIVDRLDAFLWSLFFLVGTGRGQQLRPLDAAGTEDVLHFLVDVSRHVAVKATEAPHYRRVVAQRRAGGPPPDGALYRELRARLDALSPGLRRIDRHLRPPMDVNAGRGFVFVSHVGVVHPSGFLPVSAGSVREQPLPELYRSSPLLRALRAPDRFGGVCGLCEYREVCGGSRSRAFAATGDPLAADPSCVHRPFTSSGARP
ncbi:MAG: TIGR04053 family radical SAM/SPASM domain-containing protein [Nitriliruptorales bacterium]|nr:TIGR04053 family radical SAM/SPASM domain-containing protein [Nitriliruptorales bacterium]